jgi:hypothetical protein
LVFWILSDLQVLLPAGLLALDLRLLMPCRTNCHAEATLGWVDCAMSCCPQKSVTGLGRVESKRKNQVWHGHCFIYVQGRQKTWHHRLDILTKSRDLQLQATHTVPGTPPRDL